MQVASRTAVAVIAGLTLASCSSPGSGSLPPSPTSATASPSASTRPPTPTSTHRQTPAEIAARMTPAELAGAVMMAGSRVPLPTAQMTAWIRDRHVGSILLDYPTGATPTSVRTPIDALQRLAGGSLIVAVDQEGGLIQRLHAPGFTTIPSARTQGTWAPATLEQQAYGWGSQLRAAGVNLDLAPVLDVVPPGTTSNPPIGDLDRQYGATVSTVKAAALAVANGLWRARVASCGKHFPGLGRVTGNPDYANGIVDSTTTRRDPLLGTFAALIQNHAGCLMVATAVYTQIAPGVPAAFSPTVIGGMLRADLGFRGVVISDDLGKAAQVTEIQPGERAIRFIEAGGDLIIAVNPDHADSIDAMLDAMTTRASTDSGFKARLIKAAAAVLTEKQELGLQID